MAARFAECSDQLIENLKEKSKNKNTTVSTNNWLKVWKTWAKQAGHSEEIKSYQPEELNLLLEEFYATVHKQDGTEYEPDSLRVMQAALDRHLGDNGCKFSIIRDREFSESKKVLEGKARQLRQQGKGKQGQSSHRKWRRNALGGGNSRHKQSSSPVTDGLVVAYPIFWAPRPAGTPRHDCDGFQVWPG